MTIIGNTFKARTVPDAREWVQYPDGRLAYLPRKTALELIVQKRAVRYMGTVQMSQCRVIGGDGTL